MGLTQKILLLTALLVVALVGTTVGFTTVQADALARAEAEQTLRAVRGVWETFQADRYDKLTLGVRAVANDPYFKAYVETGDERSVADGLRERGLDIKADLFLATGPDGIVIARSDRPGAGGEDLAETPIVARALEGQEATALWKQGDRLLHAVSVPMLTFGDLKGVLVAGYAIDGALAASIGRLGHAEVGLLADDVHGVPRLMASTLGPRQGALASALTADARLGHHDGPSQVELLGERYLAVAIALTDANGDTLGSLLALRSLDAQMAGYRRFRSSLLVVALGVTLVGLLAAGWLSRRITHPARELAELVERAREGSFTGAATVHGNDEISALARAFNRLLSELREKEQLIAFLRGSAPGNMADFSHARRSEDLPTLRITPLDDLPVGALFAGRYEILGVVGSGGMGIVYRAHDVVLDEVVALKLLRTEPIAEQPELLERFKQELKLARRITHRNVLRTHDFGEAGGIPYISMEFVEGFTLAQLIRDRGALPLGVGLRIAKQICSGLEAAHQQGVVHRDIKPQNMMILPDSGDLKIMDFGIARVTGRPDRAQPDLTATGVVLGTPSYLPPEQASGRPADVRSDIYALGVVLFEVFTGRLPFVAETHLAVILAHAKQTPPSPRTLVPSLPRALEWAILRCLEKEPSARYAHVVELHEDLAALSATSEWSSAPVPHA